jgi:hypothetical protein
VKTYSVSFDNPDKLGWNAALFPLYSGKIIVTSSLGEQLSVPYAGMQNQRQNWGQRI